MPAFAITRPRSSEEWATYYGLNGTGGRSNQPGGRHPKARIVASSGEKWVLPFAPTGVDLDGWADRFSILDRPGRSGLVARDGDGTPTMGITVLLGHRDHQTDIEADLAALKKIAKSGARLTFVNLSPQERGPWRLSNLRVTGELRQHGTNHITRATVALDLSAANDAHPKLSPVKGGKKDGKKNPKKPQRYTVKKGDTLRKLADRFYGEPGEWRRIATRNKIKHPDKLKAGTTIVIPPDDGPK